MFVPSKLLPPWLAVLLSEKFFNACIVHEERKNEKNSYCLDCCISFCPHCFTHHQSHRLLKIRRYMYQDVIKLDDASKLIDCALVQSYTSNSAKVVFLNRRSNIKSCCQGSGNVCSTCDRSVKDSCHYCSISCKIDHVIKTKGGLSRLINHECNFMSLPEHALDDALLTPNSVLEPAGSVRTSSTSVRTSSGSVGYGELGCMSLTCTATTEIVRKKRSSLLRAARKAFISVSEMSTRRRKGTPHRAPLH
ncbi:protein RGF1 INDUCIBLE TRANSCRIPTION FACTOR 1 [Argentina anserina]|uniref:protein RGF1 INDUCIBLE TRANSCRIPTION FACTOR 1 n=1 Tax=Argentina anserina TaxID=57926 RepID=UPI0021762167|nr:protein RGF1 INDUCIBLE TRANSCRIPTION FACTOR 1 [Potentilla anserina]